MCSGATVYDAVIGLGAMALFGWVWWVMFNAG